MLGIGHAANTRGDAEAAERSYLEVLLLAGAIHDLDVEARALADLGEVSGRLGRVREAIDFFDRAREMAQRLRDVDRIALLAANQSEVLLSVGDPERALTLAREAVTHFRKSQSPIQLAGSLYLEGASLAALGRGADGLPPFREALRLYASIGDWADAGVTIEAIAGLFVQAGDIRRAVRWLGGAEAMRERVGAVSYALFDYAGTVATARSALGGELDTLWSEGRELRQDLLILEVLYRGNLVNGPASKLFQQRNERTSIVLTDRQRDVLALAARGMSNREIAHELAISPRTVERHLTAIFGELGVDRRSSAVALAISKDLIPGAHS
jgi:ATP/maltotriose-dependent transcriptional regulator MalT